LLEFFKNYKNKMMKIYDNFFNFFFILKLNKKIKLLINFNVFIYNFFFFFFTLIGNFLATFPDLFV
jgi:hypothetical protein